ncbi:MAG: threonine-phosphate decarboxylase CobD [Bacteroidota bacterium]|nr:threonine-phosphate decarboxylase CobD [Bacteroidota bacterium]
MIRHGGNIYETQRNRGIPTDELIDFSANINPLGMAPALKDALADSFEAILHYPDIEYFNLKQSIASVYGIAPEFIFPGNGAGELIFRYFRVLRPKKVLIVAPTFSEYEQAIRLAGGEVEYFQLQEDADFNLDIAALKLRLADGFDVLVLCNPNNPTGSFLPLSQLGEIVESSQHYGMQVMVDESFIDFVCEAPQQSAVQLLSENVFVVKSLTKFYAIPGLRLGFAVSFNTDVNELLNYTREPWNINALAAMAGEIILHQTDYIRESIRYVDAERVRFVEDLKKIDGLTVYPSSVNFLLLRLDERFDLCDMSEKLLQKKFLIRNASNFEFLDSRYFRIAVRKREENILLTQALKEYLVIDK